MFARAYLFFGILLSLLFAHYSYTGWTFFSSLASASWGPRGASGFHK